MTFLLFALSSLIQHSRATATVHSIDRTSYTESVAAPSFVYCHSLLLLYILLLFFCLFAAVVGFQCMWEHVEDVGDQRDEDLRSCVTRRVGSVSCYKFCFVLSWRFVSVSCLFLVLNSFYPPPSPLPCSHLYSHYFYPFMFLLYYTNLYSHYPLSFMFLVYHSNYLTPTLTLYQLTPILLSP